MPRVIFARRANVGSVILRTCMWSPWSHTGTIDGEMVIESIALRGVVATPLKEVIARSSRWAIVDMPGGDGPAPARAKIGELYDYLGVAGVGFHQDWTDEQRRLFCSMLTAWDLKERGYAPFRLDAGRITPQHLWMLNHPIIGSN